MVDGNCVFLDGTAAVAIRSMMGMIVFLFGFRDYEKKLDKFCGCFSKYFNFAIKFSCKNYIIMLFLQEITTIVCCFCKIMLCIKEL